ncbi:hypothetical protein CLOM_g12658 [Closterium sp. NIES-68]|nr:hypothetical protein CLOM_g12658 [Closterium sp. NIES-68]GJP82754.1 hypothetical protein CLOP_g12996 [Closterium sp. NIES-67]
MAGYAAALLVLREQFKLPALVAFAAHVVYMRTLLGIRAARIKHRIFAPAMSGNPDFDRVIRVQANFVEQFPAFITSMFLCALFQSGTVAAALGAVWVVFRAAYGERYGARKLGYDIYWYTGPQYAAIGVMYILPLLSIIPTLL